MAMAPTSQAPAEVSRAASIAATPSVISRTARASLWGPPTTWTRTRGLRATKAAARSGIDAAGGGEAGDQGCGCQDRGG